MFCIFMSVDKTAVAGLLKILNASHPTPQKENVWCGIVVGRISSSIVIAVGFRLADLVNINCIHRFTRNFADAYHNSGRNVSEKKSPRVWPANLESSAATGFWCKSLNHYISSIISRSTEIRFSAK